MIYTKIIRNTIVIYRHHKFTLKWCKNFTIFLTLLFVVFHNYDIVEIIGTLIISYPKIDKFLITIYIKYYEVISI